MPSTPGPRDSLGTELRRAAAQAPDRPFLRIAGGQWSFRQIDEESDHVAAGLVRLGVRQHDHVSLMLPNGVEFVVLWFALAKLGAVAAPVNTAFRGQILADAIDLVESRLLIAHAGFRDQWAEVRPALATIATVVVVGDAAGDSAALSYEALRTVDAASAPPPADIAGADLCLLLYTSGSTGRSKAAMISHRFVLAQAAGVIEGLGLRDDDVLYCPYPLFHLDAAVMTLAPALLLRGVAAIGVRFSVSRFWDEVRATQATVFDFMGATLTMLWKQPPAPHDRDHRVRLGWGVPLPPWAPEFEQRFGCRLVELYGSTETGAILYTPLDQPRRVGTCGKPLDRWQLRLVDEHGLEVPVGEPGELVVRPNEPSVIMDGYYGMPEATLAACRDLWFHTGDLLRRDADGWYSFVGRRKDIVRRRGENISALEVEIAIETHPQVLECAVFGVPSELTEDEVMACVVPRPGAEPSAESLLSHCAARMARFMLPRYVRFMAELPKTPTDKVEKFRLRQQGVTADTWDRERAAAATPFEGPTMNFATLHTDGPVSVVTLNRPERLNAIGAELLADLHTALVQAQADPDTRVIVLAGAGRAFCAGDDLKDFDAQAASAAAIADTCEQIQRITRDIMFGPKLVIGAVQGWAVGGGFEWVLNCDMVVAADDLVGFFPEMALGHFVTGGVTHLLPRMLGHQRTMALIVLGERQDAAALQRLGIVNRVVPRTELMPRALALANEVASRSPLATSLLKRVITTQGDAQLANALELERQAAMACFASADTARRISDFAAQRL